MADNKYKYMLGIARQMGGWSWPQLSLAIVTIR